MELPYQSSDAEVPDRVYHKLGIWTMLVLVVVVLIGAMQSDVLFVGALLALAVVGTAVAIEAPLIMRRRARDVAAELERWPAGTGVVCRVARGDPRVRPTKDVTILTAGEAGFFYYDPGTGPADGPSWSVGWPEIVHLSLRVVPDQPLTGVLAIETAQDESHFAVYGWGALSAYLRNRLDPLSDIEADVPW